MDYTKLTCDQILNEVDKLIVELERTIGLLKDAKTEEERKVITVYHDAIKKKAEGLIRLCKVRALYEAIC